MVKLLKYFNKSLILYTIIAIVFVALQVVCDLSMPDRLQVAITEASKISQIREQLGYVPEVEYNAAVSAIWQNCLYMVLLSLGSVLSTIITCFFAAKVASSYSYILRNEVYKKVESLSIEEIDKFSTSSLITRSTNDITQVQMTVVMAIRMAFAAPIYAIYGIIKALQIEGAHSLSIITIIAIVALVLLVVTVFSIVLPKFKKIQALTDRLNLVTRENLTGIRIVRASNAIAFEEEKFKKANDDITKNNIFVNRVLSLFQPGMQIIMNFTSLAILWVGAYLIFDNPLVLNSVFTFQQYTMFIVMGFMQLTMIMIMIPRGVVSGNRINEVLSSVNKIHDGKGEVNTSLQGVVEFKNVSFAYDGASENVVDNVSFKINKGETLAIIGGTGAGKTSLINLICRFYDATKGEVLVDGVNVKDYKEEDLRNKIGYVPQKNILFRGTIRSNLAFGKKDLTDEEINKALVISQAKDFVDEVTLDGKVSQGGTNFSGGQKQRLCIARAIVKNPEILIFDDSFSALDFKTDQKLREALNKEISGVTNIIVAQRIGTIMHANLIIVLDNGRVAGIGKHQDLIKNCDVYKEIAYSQLSKEELENAW